MEDKVVPLQVQAILSQVRVLTPEHRRILEDKMGNSVDVVVTAVDEGCMEIVVTTKHTTTTIHGSPMSVRYENCHGPVLEFCRNSYDMGTYLRLCSDGTCGVFPDHYRGGRAQTKFDLQTMLIILDKLSEAVRLCYKKLRDECELMGEDDYELYDLDALDVVESIDKFRVDCIVDGS